MNSSLRNEVAKEVFIRIATERVNRNHFSTWSAIAGRCLEVGASFAEAQTDPMPGKAAMVLPSEELEDANDK